MAMNTIARDTVATSLGFGSVAVLSTIAAASTGWTVTNLHPAGATESIAYGLREGQQVGWATLSGAHHAGLWNGTAASWTDLHPANATMSRAYAVDHGQQVGIAVLTSSAAERPSRWNGTASSWSNLKPDAPSGQASAAISTAFAGHVAIGGWNHAGTWSADTQAFTDLHPSGVVLSQLHGMDDSQRVGVTVKDPQSQNHAGLWSGAGAHVDLHPPVATWSWARAVHGGQQVGWAFVNGVGRGSLWTGTADSWLDLTPPCATESWVQGVWDGRQVGRARFAGVNRAILWSGTAESYEDLSASLSGSWGDTTASAIWSDGRTIYVAGSGWNQATSRTEALLWSRPIGSGVLGDLDGDGVVDGADLGALLAAWASSDADADLNGDGIVDGADLGILLGEWTSC